MLGVFADPYPDELFYSICARIRQRAGYPSHTSAMQDLFGYESAVTSLAFPSHLDAFVSRLPPGSAISSDSLIAQHTLLPFYQPFLAPERSRRLRQDMCGVPSLHVLSGMATSSLPQLQWLRFCPHCVEEDKSRYGECYWHRTHQLSGIEICPLHEGYLQESNVSTNRRQRRQAFVSAEQTIEWTQQRPSQTQSPYHQVLLAFARDADFLLRQPDLSQEPAWLSLRYRKLLYERDLATYRGRVDGDLFLHRFKNCYPPQLLQFLHCEIEERVQQGWLQRLVRPPRNAQHPLHHLLLIHFLGYTAQDFFGLSVEDKPFGDGPWPCLNPVCTQYRQLSIRECRIVPSRHVSGKPIGTFVCTCGFAYSRTGPDTDHPFWVRRIHTFGPLWEERLQMLWEDKNTTLQAIASQLGVQPPTVKYHALRIGLSLSRSGAPCLQLTKPKISQHSRKPGNDPVTLETKRATWLAVMQAHPGVGVTTLRSKEPALFRWLSRNDNIWLSAHKPLKQQPHVRVNWQARDLQLAEQVRGAALLLKNLPGRPVRLTLSSIGREIGQPVLLQQSLERLPRTTEVLRACLETHEAFAVRRVWWATLAFRQEHLYPQRWQLIRSAGVARLATAPEVKWALDRALQSLGREDQV